MTEGEGVTGQRKFEGDDLDCGDTGNFAGKGVSRGRVCRGEDFHESETEHGGDTGNFEQQGVSRNGNSDQTG